MEHKMKRPLIKNVTNDQERAYYASHDVDFENVTIAGPTDGESAFKESQNISVINSKFELRYPFWHNANTVLRDSTMSNTCRAAFWYCDGLEIINVTSDGVKAIRECKNITMTASNFNSEECFWRCENIKVDNSKITGFYAFFESKNIKINNLIFKGKYSFQYVENMEIDNSNLDTKDAFWHTKNVVVKNSTIIGEYLGWYSENLTLINCHIKGTQPFCYCKNLRIVDCTFEDCDLSFEYSEVNGNIIGDIISIKNPLKGEIVMSHKPNMIIDENDRSNGAFKLIIK